MYLKFSRPKKKCDQKNSGLSDTHLSCKHNVRARIRGKNAFQRRALFDCHFRRVVLSIGSETAPISPPRSHRSPLSRATGLYFSPKVPMADNRYFRRKWHL